jgi:hypothetical protein
MSEKSESTYEPPQVKDLGRLVDITGANLGGSKNEKSSIKT